MLAVMQELRTRFPASYAMDSRLHHHLPTPHTHRTHATLPGGFGISARALNTRRLKATALFGAMISNERHLYIYRLPLNTTSTMKIEALYHRDQDREFQFTPYDIHGYHGLFFLRIRWASVRASAIGAADISTEEAGR